MDIVSDALADGRRPRVLTVIGLCTRESPAIRAGARFTSEQVARALEDVAPLRGHPASIRVDNGPEFTGRMPDLWAHLNGVTLDFSLPGKPMGDASIESFDGRSREECLSRHYFMSLGDAREAVEARRIEYEERRPHSSPGSLAPGEFASSEAGKGMDSSDRKTLV